MAAIAAAILSHVRAGDHVVAQTAHYTAALSLLADWLPRQGVAVTQVDQTDLEAFRRAIGPKTRLVYTETPTNPTMALTDLEAVSALARAQGAIVVTDNTFASSFNQLPLTLGVDLVVHSATKYLNGHSDVTAGVVAGPRKLIEPVWEYARVHGPVLHPMEAWLLGRGLKTYALRMRQHNQSGALVAEALAKASGVAKVHYPGLASHPQHELARRQMPGGFGGMMSFEVEGSTAEERFTRAQSVLRNVRLCISAASLGGTETLITHPASMIFSHQSPDQLVGRRRRAGPAATVRRSGTSPRYRGRSHFCALRRGRLTGCHDQSRIFHALRHAERKSGAKVRTSASVVPKIPARVSGRGAASRPPQQRGE